MKAARRKPCAHCPFRRDAKLALWHPSEYLRLGTIERGERDIATSRSFGCHKDRTAPKKEREVCVGWLLYQRARGVPSLALRLLLSTYPEVLAQYRESKADGPMYDSIAELVRANLEHDRERHPERYPITTRERD